MPAAHLQAALERPLRRQPKRRLPPQLQPDAVRLSYYRALLQLLKRARRLVEEVLLPRVPGMVARAAAARGETVRADSWRPLLLRTDAARTDASGEDDVNALMDKLAEAFWEDVPEGRLSKVAEDFGRRTAEHQRRQLEKELLAATGVEVPVGNPRLGALLDVFVKDNVALIKTLPTTYFEDMEKRVTAAIRNGTRPEVLAEELRQRYGVAESTARRIANDQLGKLAGELNEARQKDLGITDYTWRATGDARTRPAHAAREGRTYEWDSPPEDGHPGEAINCRCFAEPNLAAVLEANT